MRGLTSAANLVFTYGTAGVAIAATGSAVGIFGQTYSPNGTAGLSEITAHYFLWPGGGLGTRVSQSKNKCAVGSLDGYIVRGCWELKRKFRPKQVVPVIVCGKGID